MDEDWSDDLAEMVGGWDEGAYDRMEARGRGRGSKKAAVIELFGKQRYEFSFLDNSGTQTVIIRRALRVVPFYYHWLMLRVHNASILGTGATMIVRCWNTLPSRQDPREFTIGGTAPLTITLSTGQASPVLLSSTNNNQGPFFKVELVASQGSASGGQDLYAELSAVLYGRATG